MVAAPILTHTDQAPIRTPWANSDPLLMSYYDDEWGMPVWDDRGVFERLALEGFQAGLSWLTVLRRREALREAFEGFEIERLAAWDESQVEAALSNPGIIRNRAKVQAVVSNARVARGLPERIGCTLTQLVWSHMPDRSPAPQTAEEVPAHSPESARLSGELKKVGFQFVGPTIAYALMGALGIVDQHVVTSHRRGCSGLWNIDGSRSLLALPPEAIRPPR